MSQIDRYVSAADPKCQKNGSRGAPAFARTNVGARTESNGVAREPRNTAGFATGGFRAKR
jgi:hypothetical protein